MAQLDSMDQVKSLESVPRVQESTHIPTASLDLARQVTRLMAEYIETHPLLQVDKVPPTRKQAVPRVDIAMDNTTKTTTTKRKHIVPRVEKKGKSTATKK